jgi:hypothetical protein
LVNLLLVVIILNASTLKNSNKDGLSHARGGVSFELFKDWIMNSKLFILVLCFNSSYVFAENWCRTLNGNNFKIARVVHDSNFYVDAQSEYPNTRVKDCPAIKSECIDRFVQKNKLNDTLIIGNTYKKFVCAYNTRTKNANWIPESAIILEKPMIFDKAKIFGTWNTLGAKLKIEQQKESVIFLGTAQWTGSQTVNFAEFKSFLNTKSLSNIMYATDEGSLCQLKMYFIGKYMIVFDNGTCGGQNVSFNGIYQKST